MNSNNGNGHKCGRDKTSEQLSDWKKENEQKEILRSVNSHGAPQPTLTKSLTVGARGPILLQDTILIDHLANFDRERIPERVVHAKGAGAFGYFEVTHDIGQYCRAKIFNQIGKQTPVAVRFSTVGGESGTADTVRDPRGFAIKFYTEDGNWDLVGNNTPIFFIRDPILFPSFIHTQKRNPATHLKDVDMFWDFITLRPETTHQVCILFSDRGIPDGYRHMNGYGSHTFKIVNGEGKRVYCKFHLKTDQGIKNLPVERAHRISADDPDYAIHDLYNTIAEGKFPSWSMYIQIMTFEQAEKFKWNPFDVTKVWPHSSHPLIPVGKLVLNRNPINYFTDVEQLAFSPANMVPGVEPSPDKMLQGRLFSYSDTHRHRLGANYAQLPVNCPFKSIHVNNYGRGLSHDRQITGAPNYFPNSFNGPDENPMCGFMSFHVRGDVQRYDSSEDDNFTQADQFWTRVLKGDERKRLVENIACHLKNVQPFIQERAVKNFTSVNPEFGRMVLDGLQRNGKNGYYTQFQSVHQHNHYSSSRSSNL